MITIINYGLGNIQAFTNIFDQLRISYKITSSPKDIIGAERIILPGVGAFDYAISCLEKLELFEVINEVVTKKGTPILGVCVGMQVMANYSDEGSKKGFGWFDCDVKKLPDALDTNKKLLLPHMGWNSILKKKDNQILSDIHSNEFYFLHSYYVDLSEKDQIISETFYGIEFPSIINQDNIFGIQFHPEKSHSSGIKILKNFSEAPVA